MNTTSKAVRSFFPSTPYFPSIGNNDLPGHYVMPRHNDTWYSDLLKIWQDAILCKDCKMKYETTTEDELRRTFLYGGYYRVSIAGLLLIYSFLQVDSLVRIKFQPNFSKPSLGESLLFFFITHNRGVEILCRVVFSVISASAQLKRIRSENHETYGDI